MALLAAAGHVDITPAPPFPPRLFTEGGHTPFREVRDRLEVNVLALRLGNVEAVVASADLLCVGEELHREILRRTGLPEDALFLTATHTHYAPMAQSGMPLLGVVEAAFVDVVAERVAALVGELRGRLRSASLTYHEGTLPLAMNRRLARFRVWRDGIGMTNRMGPDPEGPVDATARFVRVDAEGERIAVLWNYACHPTGYPDLGVITADYPGVVRETLRQEHGRAAIVFLQGCAGDLRPPFSARVTSVKGLVKRVCLGPLFGPPSLPEWEAWTGALASGARDILETPGASLPVESLGVARHDVPLSTFAADAPPRDVVSFQGVEIGSQLVLAGVSLEPVQHYGQAFAAAWPGRRVLAGGYLGQLLGYLPTDAMLPEGGYEVSGFARKFAFSGHYRPGVEREFAQGMERLRAAARS